MANFIGFKQVTLDSYKNDYTEAGRRYRLWLVRDENAGTAQIYFGNRLYAEVNQADADAAAQISKIAEILGLGKDEKGDFVNPLPISDDAILSAETVTNAVEALKALSKAISEAETVNEGQDKEISALKKVSTQVVDNYARAAELTGLTAGQIVYAKEAYTDTETSKEYEAGAYIVTNVSEAGVPTFEKIQSVAEGSKTLAEVIKEVEANTKSIESLSSSHTITGDDVETEPVTA